MRTLVCLGDSITAGYPYGEQASWVSGIKSWFDGEVINAGICNDTVGVMLARFDRDVMAYNPNFVIILGGTNDAWQGIPLEQTKCCFEKLILRSRAINALPILGLPAPIIKEQVKTYFNHGDVESFLLHLNSIRSWINDFAAQNGISTLDFFTPLRRKESDEGNSELFADGGHPNRRGYFRLAESIKEPLQQIISKY